MTTITTEKIEVQRALLEASLNGTEQEQGRARNELRALLDLAQRAMVEYGPADDRGPTVVVLPQPKPQERALEPQGQALCSNNFGHPHDYSLREDGKCAYCLHSEDAQEFKLPKPSEEMRAYWKCDSCDGRGHDGEMHSQGYFQPPEPAQCPDCNGSGMTPVDAYAPWEVQEIARAYASQLALPAGPVPEGYKLVPELPTREMAQAYMNPSLASWPQRYFAMLDAAPQPPAPSPAVAQPVADERIIAMFEAEISKEPEKFRSGGDVVYQVTRGELLNFARAALCPPAEEGGKS